MDPFLNCVTGVCCPPEEQRKALAKGLVEYCGMKHAEAVSVAEWLLNTFDLAEAGTLAAFKASIARLARNTDTV